MEQLPTGASLNFNTGNTSSGDVIALKHKTTEKPVHRTKLRLFLGRSCYTLLRYVDWYRGNKRFAGQIRSDRLEYKAISHKTPLIRKLHNVDVDMKLQYNKAVNLRIAAGRLNGLVIKPSETFSFWKLVGKPTYRKGYLDGLVLKPDGTFGAGAGGGLCQLTNLIYWITLHTPLTIVERYRHSHDVFPDVNRTQPFGSGATCVYNYKDLQIYNGTGIEYQLVVFLAEDFLEGEWRTQAPLSYRYEVYEKEHYITSTFWGGYIRNNTIFRRIYNSDNELSGDEFVTENHALMMYQPLLQGSE